MEAGTTPPENEAVDEKTPADDAAPATETAPAAEAAPAAAAAAAAPPPPSAPAPSLEKSFDERKALLDSALQLKGAQGWRIENRSDFQATVAKGKQHSHGLHIFLTIITAGLWGLFVWLPLTIFGGLKRVMISIDQYGNAVEQKL